MPVEATVAVCTRDRSEMVAAAAESVLESRGVTFELLVIDQSCDDATERALSRALGDTRVRYVRSASTGVAKSRNLAVELAQGPVVVFTDDDCVVPPEWLAGMVGAFADPSIGVAFSRVGEGPHDTDAGFIPSHKISRSRVVRTPWLTFRARGMGAGMAVRRSVIQAIGGFDDMLGPGGPFRGGEDHDVALRSLLGGWSVAQVAGVEVVHHGFRTWDEGRDLSKRDFFSVGAVLAKPLRSGRASVWPSVAIETAEYVFADALSDLLHAKRPMGFGRARYIFHGFRAGWRTPLQRSTLLYRAGEPRRSTGSTRRAGRE